MTVEAELADGRILEFPDGTSPDVIQATVKRMLGPQPATAGDRGRAALGGVNRGISGLLGLPMDTAENLVNLGIAGFGSAATALGRPDLAPEPLKGTVGGSQSIATALERLGIGTTNPRPDDAASRMLFTGGKIAGGSMFPGATIGSTLAAATGGALAGETLGPEWEGVGAMAPAAASQAAGAIKNAVAAKASPNLATFKQAGATPSVGQATESTFLQGLENLASKFPGGSGIIKKFIDNQQAAFGAKARTGVSAEDAGRAVEKGITGSGGFLDRTKSEWTRLDGAVAAKIPQGSAFAPSNTVQALDDLTRPVPGAQKTTGALVNPKVAEIRQNLADDLAANNGQIPFEALRAVRSKVGSMLDDAMVSGIPGGELKKLYGALSKDMEAAANQAGAGREFARQNNFWRSRMERVEGVLERVIGKGSQPEDIFKRLMPTDPDQANKLRATMRSLRPEERRVVSEAVANRLGRAKPGQQLESGDVFSSEVFLTNWNRLSDGAKAQLFPESPLRENMDRIAKAASTIREGKGLYANPSGTAGTFAAYTVYTSPLASAASGSIAPVAAAAGAAGSAYIGAKMLTNPRVVEWLAKPVNPAKPGEAQAHLARLAVIYNQIDDPALKKELDQFIQSSQANK